MIPRILLLAALGVVFQDEKKPPAEPADALVTTRHAIDIRGERVSYAATAGTMTLKTEAGKPQAKIFFISYVRTDAPDPSRRPLTVSFNGGPGSSSVWLHLGLLGPRRVRMKDDASVEAPPFSLVENPESLLDRTDLLFIDPVATGYSRAAEGVDPKTFHGVEEDIESVGRFIHLYVTRNKRWNSPRFLIGESYGTTRAAGLAAHLQDAYGMELNGVLLVSSILDFSTVSLGDLPSVLFLPTFTATAWYHKRLSPDRQKDLRKTLQESEEFAIGEYATALLRGNSLPDDGRKKIAERLSALTGLSAEYVERSNLRISQSRFCKELLRTDRLTVGRLDARYAGRDKDAAGERYEYDPSYSAIQGPYTECLYSYVRRDLQFESDQVYEILTGKVQPWNYGKDAARASLNVAPRLRQAMTRNPHLKVLIANGYYDLATPYFATQYTVNHLDLEPPLRGNIRMTYYESGHMMYIHGPSLAQQRKDLDQFLDWALKP